MNTDFGVMGLGVMGQNLVLNMERNGYSVSVFNRSPKKTREFMKENGRGKRITPHEDLQAFVAALKKPRRVLLMVKAGEAVDAVLASLKPLLEKGDIVIDGGNSFFMDSERRFEDLRRSDLRFVGMGISGGEEGALWGPSLMPGGDQDSYAGLEPLLEKIAAKTDSGPCLTYVGRGGSGHFVKMVHNGIEYGDLQLIAESYDLLKGGLGLSNREIARIFKRWNEGPLKSYLVEITGIVVDFPDDQGEGYLVDKILDKAGQKGTGQWTVETALQERVAVPTIAAALDARIISGLREERTHAAAIYASAKRMQKHKPDSGFVEKISKALYASKVCSYAQGFALMSKVSKTRNYGLNLSEIARIWKGGCIIRAQFLDRIREAYQRRADLCNLLVDSEFGKELLSSLDAWREVLTFAYAANIPTPAISASFSYFHSYTSERLPANLIQAQRDYFGAHTYERVDKSGAFHTDWTPPREELNPHGRDTDTS